MVLEKIDTNFFFKTFFTTFLYFCSKTIAKFAFTLLRSTCHFEEVKNIPEIFTSIHEIQESLSRMDSELAEVVFPFSISNAQPFSDQSTCSWRFGPFRRWPNP